MSSSEIVVQPLIKTVTVELSPPEAFQLFTRDMGTWWPLDTHSIASDTYEGSVKATALAFEEHVGGRIIEEMSDGARERWGEVLAWEPPRRVVFSWKPSLEDVPHTEVEVTFTDSGNGTEVRLEHRGWERLGVSADAKRAGYDSGWPIVLARFGSFAVERSV
jgi:uncharacterized protein YndB with AHSA1/START domain